RGDRRCREPDREGHRHRGPGRGHGHHDRPGRRPHRTGDGGPLRAAHQLHGDRRGGPMTTTTELKDAVIALVREQAAAAAPEARSYPGYVEPWQLVADLRKRGVLDHPDADHQREALRDDAKRSMEGKVRRALDAAVKDAALIRHSVRGGDGMLPLLNGE